VIVPLLLEVNFTPTSTPGPAPESATVGVVLLLQIVHGHVGGGGVVTMKVALPLLLVLLTLPRTAEIVELPAACPVAKPPLLIVATVVFDEFHVTCVVMFCVLLF
jgi:hypothetical protein